MVFSLCYGHPDLPQHLPSHTDTTEGAASRDPEITNSPSFSFNCALAKEHSQDLSETVAKSRVGIRKEGQGPG